MGCESFYRSPPNYYLTKSPVLKKDACYDSGIPFFGENGFSEGRGSLTQNRWKIRPLNFCVMILVVHLGHGIFHPVQSGFTFLQILFSGEVFRSHIEVPTSEKKWCTSIVASAPNSRTYLLKFTVPLAPPDITCRQSFSKQENM